MAGFVAGIKRKEEPRTPVPERKEEEEEEPADGWPF